MSIGQKFADLLVPEFGPERALSIPWAPFDTYPAAMTLMDIALAPAGQDNLYRGKSDLRWLEAGALGIPLVADPLVYPEIEPGVTGFHVATPAEVTAQLIKLVDDRDLRERVGAAAKAHVVTTAVRRSPLSAGLRCCARSRPQPLSPPMSLDTALARIASLQTMLQPQPVQQRAAAAPTRSRARCRPRPDDGPGAAPVAATSAGTPAGQAILNSSGRGRRRRAAARLQRLSPHRPVPPGHRR